MLNREHRSEVCDGGERNRYMWVRLGYQRSGNLEGKAAAASENRVPLEMTARSELPRDVWLVNPAPCQIYARCRRRAFESLPLSNRSRNAGATIVPVPEAKAPPAKAE
jgi:hypothetical protein